MLRRAFLTIIVFFAVQFFLPQTSLAQGTYSCHYTGSGPLAFRCDKGPESCAANYQAGNECRAYANDPNACNNAGPFDCVPAGTCGGLKEDCCTTGGQCDTGLTCVAGVCEVNQSGQASGAGNPLCGGANAISTAIGCIPVEKPSDLIGFLLPWAIGIAGGIAFLLIIYAGFLIMSSSGDPHRLQAGKELLTSTFAALLLLVFAAFLLRLIGVNILGIFS